MRKLGSNAFTASHSSNVVHILLGPCLVFAEIRFLVNFNKVADSMKCVVGNEF